MSKSQTHKMIYERMVRMMIDIQHPDQVYKALLVVAKELEAVHARIGRHHASGSRDVKFKGEKVV